MHIRYPKRTLYLLALLTQATVAVALVAGSIGAQRLNTRPATSVQLEPDAGLVAFPASPDRTQSPGQPGTDAGAIITLEPTPALASVDVGSVDAASMPTAVATTAVATPELTYVQATESQMRDWLTLAGWPTSEHDWTLKIAWCESHWIPGNSNGLMSGLLQISLHNNATIKGSWFAYYGIDESLWSDPVTNLRVGYWIYRDFGKGNWACAA